MMTPITLYLIGFAGTGKYTVAKEIAKSGYKIVDNHLINNPIFSLLNLDEVTPIPESAWQAVVKIRKAVLDYVANDVDSDYVFTNALVEKPSDHVIYDQVKEATAARGGIFVPVRLLITIDKLAQRITSPGRKERFKTTSLANAFTDLGLIAIAHPNQLDLNVSELVPVEAAQLILSHIQAILATDDQLRLVGARL